MRNLAVRSLIVSLVAAAVIGCHEDLVMNPQPMSLEVEKTDAEPFRISFTVRVLNWDGETAIEYSASACSPAGDVFLCMGGPFVEKSVVAARVTQPVTWTEDQCGLLVVFDVSLGSGEQAELTHITCS